MVRETLQKEDFYRNSEIINVYVLNDFTSVTYKNYGKYSMIDSCILNEDEMNKLNEKKRYINIKFGYNPIDKNCTEYKDYEEYRDQLFDKYVQPYIDAGFIEYVGIQDVGGPYCKSIQEAYRSTKKCWDGWREIMYEKTEGKKKRAYENAIKVAGVQATDGKGVKPKYMNPRCYTEDPGMPGESATELITFAILTIPCLLFYIGPILIAWMWTSWVINFIKRREGIRQMWEMEYRRQNGLL